MILSAKNTFNNRIDLRWMIIASLFIHWAIFNYLHIEQQSPPLKKLDVELIMELVKPKPVIKEPPPPPPKPVIKEPPPPPPKPVIKEPPPLPPKPVVREVIAPPLPVIEPVEFLDELPPLSEEDVLPIEKPVQKAVEPQIDPVQEAKIIKDYGQLLAAHISQFKRYPRIAQRRGWEGELTLEVRLDKLANILNISIYNKSNYEVLDQEAIKMIERSKPLPMPTNLTSETFTVFIPIKFGLR
ncbi:MAG: TonB family protein [Methylophilaceae bacterium]|nr:TonB family protein [Methylophilaceae bacterium]